MGGGKPRSKTGPLSHFKYYRSDVNRRSLADSERPVKCCDCLDADGRDIGLAVVPLGLSRCDARVTNYCRLRDQGISFLTVFIADKDIRPVRLETPLLEEAVENEECQETGTSENVKQGVEGLADGGENESDYEDACQTWPRDSHRIEERCLFAEHLFQQVRE